MDDTLGIMVDVDGHIMWGAFVAPNWRIMRVTTACNATTRLPGATYTPQYIHLRVGVSEWLHGISFKVGGGELNKNSTIRVLPNKSLSLVGELGGLLASASLTPPLSLYGNEIVSCA